MIRSELRVWLYRKVLAFSLRKRAASLRPSDIGSNATERDAKRAAAEMLRLAETLEAKAARIEGRPQGGAA